MDLINVTGMQAGYTLGMEPSGREHLVVAVKGTFTIPAPGRKPEWLRAQIPLVEVDTFPVSRDTRPLSRSVAIFCEARNGVRLISGAKNQATAMAFGGLCSSCVRPGAHSARHQGSRKDLTPCRMALPFVSVGAHAPHSDETLGPTATRGSSHSARRLRSLAFLCSSFEFAASGA